VPEAKLSGGVSEAGGVSLKCLYAKKIGPGEEKILSTLGKHLEVLRKTSKCFGKTSKCFWKDF
jgi:hypothetical protein